MGGGGATSDLPHRILVVEDEPLIAEDLADLCRLAGYRVAGIAHGTERAVELAGRMRPSVSLVDVNLGEATDGIHLAERLRCEFGVPVIFVTSYVDRGTLSRAGAAAPLGYIVKPFRDDQVRSTLEVALAQLGRFAPRAFDPATLNRPGVPPVSEAEARVLHALWEGNSTRQIARALHLSPNTVKFHLKNLYQKLEVGSRVELMRAIQARMGR